MSGADHRVLVVTGGHPYEAEPFFAMFDAYPALRWTHVPQPDAQNLFDVERASAYDALVLYDMPGIRFHQDAGPQFIAPDRDYRRRFMALVEAGHGFVFLHHAIAGWPAWPEYGELIGGRFLYLPQTVRGRARQDSGYRHDVSHRVRVLAQHPVTEGLPDTFSITDELYLYEVFEDSVTPLLSSNYTFDREHFYSAHQAVSGNMFCNNNWPHSEGSPLIGWHKNHGNSRICYLQPGDGPTTFSSPHYRRLLKNAILWAAA